jgi:hypothetical protein
MELMKSLSLASPTTASKKLKVHSRLPRTMSFEALARLVMIPSLFI